MVRETLDWMVESIGIEVIVVNVKFPLENTDQIVADVKTALELHQDIKLCIFSHISSMVYIDISIFKFIISIKLLIKFFFFSLLLLNQFKNYLLLLIPTHHLY